MSPLESMIRQVLATAGGLGYKAASLGIPPEVAVHDIANGPEADALLAAILPKIREAAREG